MHARASTQQGRSDCLLILSPEVLRWLITLPAADGGCKLQTSSKGPTIQYTAASLSGFMRHMRERRRNWCRSRKKYFDLCGRLNPPDGNRGIIKVRPTKQARLSWNPPDGNRGIVKVKPGGPRVVYSQCQEGRTLTIPRLPSGGFKIVTVSRVGWTLQRFSVACDVGQVPNLPYAAGNGAGWEPAPHLAIART
jgi:hypothetical protein